MKICRICKKYKDLSEFHRDRQYRKTKCNTCRSVDRRQYYIKNKEKEDKLHKKYIKSNNYEHAKKYQKIQLKTNIQFKLKHNLRVRLTSAIKQNQKVGSAVRDLGCTIPELKLYLESKFQPEMTWDNYGREGWHIDHVKPLSSFDLTDRKQLLEAVHYKNLQPLWAEQNLSKSSS